MKNEYMISLDRVIEILNPEHREDHPNMDEINEACRMGMEAMQELRDREMQRISRRHRLKWPSTRRPYSDLANRPKS